MIPKRCLTVAVAVAVTATMAAATAAVAADTSCGDATTQTAMNQCYGKLLDAANAQLNTLYQQLMAKSAAPEQAALRTAELAWITYRDKECAYETTAEQGGSVQPMLLAICLTTQTDARSAEFKAFLICAPDDMTCSAPTPTPAPAPK